MRLDKTFSQRMFEHLLVSYIFVGSTQLVQSRVSCSLVYILYVILLVKDTMLRPQKYYPFVAWFHMLRKVGLSSP